MACGFGVPRSQRPASGRMSANGMTIRRVWDLECRADDLQLALDLWGDADVTRLLGGPFTPDQVEQRLARELTHHKQHGIQYWPLFLLESGEHVGCCGLRPRAQTETVRELGYQFDRRIGERVTRVRLPMQR